MVAVCPAAGRILDDLRRARVARAVREPPLPSPLPPTRYLTVDVIRVPSLRGTLRRRAARKSDNGGQLAAGALVSRPDAKAPRCAKRQLRCRRRGGRRRRATAVQNASVDPAGTTGDPSMPPRSAPGTPSLRYRRSRGRDEDRAGGAPGWVEGARHPGCSFHHHVPRKERIRIFSRGRRPPAAL